MATQKQIEANRKNAKKGGRKRGKKSPVTIEREIAFKHLRERVVRMTDSLINSQAALAKGLTFLYVIKTIKGKRQKPRMIKDQLTIEAYLADELSNSDSEFYFMATERPNNQAVDSLLDRTYDKSIQRTELTNPDGNLKTIIIERHGK